MSNLCVLELSELDAVIGGQTTSTSAEGSLQTPAGQASLKAGKSVTEPNAYLRCLNIVGGQAGMMESPNSMGARQKELCSPLLQQGNQ